MSDTQEVGRRCRQRWYTCQLCGFNYPESKMIVQNGLVRCQGTDTCNCVDEPGYRAHRKRLVLPIERRPDPLPVVNEDL